MFKDKPLIFQGDIENPAPCRNRGQLTKNQPFRSLHEIHPHKVLITSQCFCQFDHSSEMWRPGHTFFCRVTHLNRRIIPLSVVEAEVEILALLHGMNIPGYSNDFYFTVEDPLIKLRHPPPCTVQILLDY